MFIHALVCLVLLNLLLILQAKHRSQNCHPTIFGFLFLLSFAVVVLVFFQPSAGYIFNSINNGEVGEDYVVGGVCDGEDSDIIQGIIIRTSGRPIFYVMGFSEVPTWYPP